jgi:peptidoglycan/xylan/chitin deacetylase (PgdA/CDA1 family)
MTDTLVLCYHAVSHEWSAPLSVTPANLEMQLSTLLKRGYHPATFSEAALRPQTQRTLAVTFDDAFRSVIDVAFPLLSALGIPATVFAPTRFAGTPVPMSWPGIDQWHGGPHEDELHCMSWSEIKKLDEAGWEIGSHSHTHPYLPTLDDEALTTELATSREICSERLGKRCRSLAYPFGAYDDRVVAAARQAGYEAACTLPAHLHDAIPLAWPRIGVYHSDTRLSFLAKVSPKVRRLRASSAWSVVELARHGLRPAAGRSKNPAAEAKRSVESP